MKSALAVHPGRGNRVFQVCHRPLFDARLALLNAYVKRVFEPRDNNDGIVYNAVRDVHAWIDSDNNNRFIDSVHATRMLSRVARLFFRHSGHPAIGIKMRRVTQ